MLPADDILTNHGQTVTAGAIDKLGKLGKLYKSAKEKEKADLDAGLKQSRFTIKNNDASITKEPKAN